MLIAIKLRNGIDIVGDMHTHNSRSGYLISNPIEFFYDENFGLGAKDYLAIYEHKIILIADEDVLHSGDPSPMIQRMYNEGLASLKEKLNDDESEEIEPEEIVKGERMH